MTKRETIVPRPTSYPRALLAGIVFARTKDLENNGKPTLAGLTRSTRHRCYIVAVLSEMPFDLRKPPSHVIARIVFSPVWRATCITAAAVTRAIPFRLSRFCLLLLPLF